MEVLEQVISNIQTQYDLLSPSQFKNAISVQDILDQILQGLRMICAEKDEAKILPFLFVDDKEGVESDRGGERDELNISREISGSKSSRGSKIDSIVGDVDSIVKGIASPEGEMKRKDKKGKGKKKDKKKEEKGSKSARVKTMKAPVKIKSVKGKKKMGTMKSENLIEPYNSHDTSSEVEIDENKGEVTGNDPEDPEIGDGVFKFNTDDFAMDVKNATLRMNSNNYRRKHKGSIIRDQFEREKRTLIAKEIETTERSYRDGICILLNEFYEPLKESQVISQLELDIMFSPNILNKIYQTSQVLLSLVEQRVQVQRSDWYTNICIGDLFIDAMNELREYSKFVNSYDIALKTYRNLMQTNQDFAEQLKNIQSKECCRHRTLEDFLISVVQRVPRYKMLLEDIMKYTNQEHPDYQNLLIANQEISDLATWINAEKSIDERRTYTSELCESLNLKQDPFLVFIYEETLYNVPVPTDKKERAKINTKYQLFLFNKMVLTAYYKNGDLKSVRDYGYKKFVLETAEDKSIRVNGKRYYMMNNFKRSKLIEELTKQQKLVDLESSE